VAEGRQVLRQAFKDLEQEVPDSARRLIRNLRHPKARWVRAPLGALCVVGGVFSFLPVLGVWMLPLGLLLIAHDVAFLRKPVGLFTIWGVRKFAAAKRRVAGRSKATEGAAADGRARRFGPTFLQRRRHRWRPRSATPGR
jgi:hypothetical protein